MSGRRRATKMAATLGVTLARGHSGLAVNGHHGSYSIAHSEPRGGCGTYDLLLNLETETVDCHHCGATDLVVASPPRATS